MLRSFVLCCHRTDGFTELDKSARRCSINAQIIGAVGMEKARACTMVGHMPVCESTFPTGLHASRTTHHAWERECRHRINPEGRRRLLSKNGISKFPEKHQYSPSRVRGGSVEPFSLPNGQNRPLEFTMGSRLWETKFVMFTLCGQGH